MHAERQSCMISEPSSADWLCDAHTDRKWSFGRISAPDSVERDVRLQDVVICCWFLRMLTLPYCHNHIRAPLRWNWYNDFSLQGLTSGFGIFIFKYRFCSRWPQWSLVWGCVRDFPIRSRSWRRLGSADGLKHRWMRSVPWSTPGHLHSLLVAEVVLISYLLLQRPLPTPHWRNVRWPAWRSRSQWRRPSGPRTRTGGPTFLRGGTGSPGTAP